MDRDVVCDYLRDSPETVAVNGPFSQVDVQITFRWIILLESLGFQDVGRKDFRNSAIPGIDAVEVRDDLIVEGTRP